MLRKIITNGNKEINFCINKYIIYSIQTIYYSMLGESKLLTSCLNISLLKIYNYFTIYEQCLVFCWIYNYKRHNNYKINKRMYRYTQTKVKNYNYHRYKKYVWYSISVFCKNFLNKTKNKFLFITIFTIILV